MTLVVRKVGHLWRWHCRLCGRTQDHTRFDLALSRGLHHHQGEYARHT